VNQALLVEEKKKRLKVYCEQAVLNPGTGERSIETSHPEKSERATQKGRHGEESARVPSMENFRAKQTAIKWGGLIEVERRRRPAAIIRKR